MERKTVTKTIFFSLQVIENMTITRKFNNLISIYSLVIIRTVLSHAIYMTKYDRLIISRLLGLFSSFFLLPFSRPYAVSIIIKRRKKKRNFHELLNASRFSFAVLWCRWLIRQQDLVMSLCTRVLCLNWVWKDFSTSWLTRCDCSRFHVHWLTSVHIKIKSISARLSR